MSQSAFESLFVALRHGDPTGFGQSLPTIRGRLLRLAKQRVAEREAEDVVQEALATLWEKRAAVRDQAHLVPFLLQILRYKIGNSYLRARREQERLAAAAEIAARPRQDGDPEAQVRTKELESILERAIRRCGEENPMWGRILGLLADGRSPAEIELELGSAARATLYSRIHRARRRLKEILKSEFGLEP